MSKAAPITSFGHLMLRLFRREPPLRRADVAPLSSSSKEMDALRVALERQIAADERSRKRWGDHG